MRLLINNVFDWESHSPSSPYSDFAFVRRLSSLAVSRSLIRRSSLIRGLSVHLSLSPRSFSSCTSVQFRLLSLPLPCSFSRCSSVQLGLFSLALSLFISFGFASLCRLLSHFFCPSRSLYFKLVETSKNLFKKYTEHGYSKKYSSSKKVFTRLFSCFAQFYFTRLKTWVSMRFRAIKTSVALENGDCVIFYLYACDADGRTDVRSGAKFLGWIDNQIFLARGLRSLALGAPPLFFALDRACKSSTFSNITCDLFYWIVN